MLPKQSDYRKVKCVFAPNTDKQYTFLCTEELFSKLNVGDFVIVHVNDEFKIVQVVCESEEKLTDNICYKHIYKIL